MTRLIFGAFAWLAVFLAYAITHPAAAQDRLYRIDTVVLSGDTLPGTGGLQVAVDTLDLNNSGELLFAGSWFNDLGESRNGLWLWRQGEVIPVAVSGDPVPGVEGAVFGEPLARTARLNSAGQVAFVTQSIIDSAVDQSLFAGTPGNLRLIARSGEPAPGAGGLLFDRDFAVDGTSPFIQLNGPALNNTGEFAFTAKLTECLGCGAPDVVHRGLWSTTAAGGLELIALTGEPAPGTTASAFARFLFHSFNDSGQLAFRALIDDAFSLGNEGLWTGTPVAVSLVAKSGDEAPGTGGLSFTIFGSEGVFGPALNTTGDLLFRAFLNSGDTASNSGLWLLRDGIVSLVARAGEPAPGTDGTPFWLTFSPQINADGAIAFQGRLGTNMGEGIWLGTPEAHDLLVRSGDQAPGTSGQIFASFLGVALNAAGDVAIGGRLDTSTFENGIWVGNLGGVSAVVRSGQNLEVRPGDFRAVRFTSFSGNPGSQGGLLTNFNDAGQIMFMAEFEDHTRGVFLATPIDPALNQPPTADAGPDQSIQTLETVTLDGTGSADPEGDTLTYVWSLGGAQIATGPTPTVGPFAAGSHSVTLTVTDPLGAGASDSMVLTVVNRAPVASAGPDLTIQTLETVTLDGSGSSDPEGGALTYVWSLGGTQIATGPTPTVGPFDDGSHTISLTVTDPEGAAASDTMVLTVLNRSPVANAGPDQSLQLKGRTGQFTLDGAASGDPDGSIVSYVWTEGGAVVGNGPTVVLERGEGVHGFTLTVTDDDGAAASDSVAITLARGKQTSGL
jgi:hypothetical protein